MVRLYVVLAFLTVAFDIFALVDVSLIDRRRIRALNRPAWLVIIIILPLIGALLWFFVGRQRLEGSDQRRMVAPDDDPAFLRNLRRDEEQDERIRRLEQELADLDDDQPTKD
ncbi:MAG: PLDc N-terminal domain-containing protein [Rhodoglobus sp.]